MMRIAIIFLVLFDIYLSNTATATELVLGVYTSDKASSMYKKFSPVIKYLKKNMTERLGHESIIKLKIYKSYEAAQNAMVSGEIDFARFGPASYIQVKFKNPGIQLLLMENKKGKKRFNGVIVVATNSNIKTLSDIRGRSFAFGNKRSTIGRYLAQAEIIKIGIFAKDLKKIAYLGRHDKVFKAVSIGDYDSGSLKESTYKKLNKNNQLRIIHTFENVSKPWIIRSDMSEKIKHALKRSLLALKDKNILKALKINGFFETNDKMYNFVRVGMAATVDFLK